MMHGVGDVGGTGMVCDQADIALLSNEEQFTVTPSQSDLPCRYLSVKLKPALANPSYGAPVTSVVLASMCSVVTSGGERCV